MPTAQDTVNVAFTDGSAWTQTKVGMVNDCLLVIGEVPFVAGTLLDTLPLGTDGETATRLVETTMVEVQSRGWYFNTDYNYLLIPDTDGFITMPPNALRVDFGESEDLHRYTLKNGRIYDYQNFTYKIDKNLTADVIWLVDYSVLPPEAYEYIGLRAARKFQQRVVGASSLDSYTTRDEVDSLTNLQRRQLQSQDYTISNKKVNNRLHNGYLQSGLYGTASRRSF